MRVTPKTEEQIIAESLFPDGEYDFECIKGTDKISKNGNEMIEVVLKVFDAEGRTTLLTDYLLESFPMKLLHAAKVCGLDVDYQAGNLEGWMFENKTGRVKIGTQPGKDGYPAKNTVRDYLAPPPAPARAAKPTARKPAPAMADDLADEIPF